MSEYREEFPRELIGDRLVDVRVDGGHSTLVFESGHSVLITGDDGGVTVGTTFELEAPS